MIGIWWETEWLTSLKIMSKETSPQDYVTLNVAWTTSFSRLSQTCYAMHLLILFTYISSYLAMISLETPVRLCGLQHKHDNCLKILTIFSFW